MKKLFLLLSFFFISSSFATEQAEQIFKQLAPSLYQIKLIDIASGEKSSIGSAFQITEDGLIATNYHVISGFARHPKKYQMEYLDHLGNTGKLSLKSVDVINDLALVQREVAEPMPYFVISPTTPIKGEQLYSLGNPHDLGMIVVPGTYNGLKKESFNDKIHFTGSVNPGMSGGPVVNSQGEVVGVNVATSGNQIGFLVPHSKLANLFNNYKANPPTNITKQMAVQLAAHQKRLLTTMLDSPWQLKQLGKGAIPTIDVPFIKCWGDSNSDKPDALYLGAVAQCAIDDDIYIDSRFFTGTVEMEYRYLKAKKLSDTKFYHLYQNQLSHARANNKATKDDVTEFKCQDDTTQAANKQMPMISKSVLCTRAYKAFPGLFDVVFIAGSVDKNQQALISHFTLSGVKEDLALRFTQKFMESVSWKQ